MSGKVKLTQGQAELVEKVKAQLKGVRFRDLVSALEDGYEIEPEYKVGEWVYYDNGEYAKPRYITSLIRRVDDSYVHFSEARCMALHEVRHANPEEIKAEKERRLWKKIDREVGEFRKGDIGITKHGDIFEWKSTLTDYYENDALKGIYPAESFISFEDDEK